jgi:hypothetical protein
VVVAGEPGKADTGTETVPCTESIVSCTLEAGGRVVVDGKAIHIGLGTSVKGSSLVEAGERLIGDVIAHGPAPCASSGEDAGGSRKSSIMS